MRPKIGDERVRNSAQRFAPGLLGKDRIATDSQNLAMDSFELGALRFVGRNLFVSGGSKGKRVKSQYHVLATAIIAQFDFEPLHFGLGDDARNRKVRRGITNF
jgi:hypothetical protein